MPGLLTLFDTTERDLRRYQKKVVEPAGRLEKEVEQIGDLAQAYAELREQVQNGTPLPEVLPRVFALARESARRFLGMRPYDVQLLGAMAIFEGKIAEMKTGEGKTLVATLAVAANALLGKGIHLVTVNDYLARRDAEWMRPVFRGLGLSVGIVQHATTPEERRAAYASDVTYVTNSELGFDYLRDNMALAPAQLVLRAETPLHIAIVDEVDSILIDEARTPLIISGPAEKATDMYYRMTEVAKRLERGEKPESKEKEPTGDFTVEEKQKNIQLTDAGIKKAEAALGVEGLFSPENMELAHMLIQALRAQELYHKDQEYVVQEGQVVIVDEFTGRLMPGRRYGEGLHQAIEAKEGVKIERENQTLATITYQNFFRQYQKVSGMTGTSKTEEKEFQEIYEMDVTVVPTNRPMIRQDFPDVVYRSEGGKFLAVIEEIAELYEKGQPVLVGTVSIDKSERLSAMLRDPRRYLPRLEQRVQAALKAAEKASEQEQLKKLLAKPAALKSSDLDPLIEANKGNLKTALEDLKRAVHTLEILRKGVPHQVLNARYHDQEAEIVAQAGRSKTITIATNMAGRGTDIKLGGNPEALGAAALAQAGITEPKERIDLFLNRIMQNLDQEASVVATELELPESLIEEVRRIREACRQDAVRVKELGGLHILGTERHESRRIDNQLRGRSGRQGDPGSSRFYLSFDDDLMRLFSSDRARAMLDRMGFDDSEAIEHKLLTRQIESAQKKVEVRNFGTRKQLLQFDDVMSRQREVVYQQRRTILLGQDQEAKEAALGMVEEAIAIVSGPYLERNIHPEDRDLAGLKSALVDLAPSFENFDYDSLVKLDPEESLDALVAAGESYYAARESELGEKVMRAVERFVILSVVDSAWKEHLHNLDVLKQGIGLRSYGQRDPFAEYRVEATRVFNEMSERIQQEACKFLFRLKVETEPSKPQVFLRVPAPTAPAAQATPAVPPQPAPPAPPPQVVRRAAPIRPIEMIGSPPANRKIGRNDPCWCGSGKKYKYCHGKTEADAAAEASQTRRP